MDFLTDVVGAAAADFKVYAGMSHAYPQEALSHGQVDDVIDFLSEVLPGDGEEQGEAGKHPRGATEWYWREIAAGRAENSR